MRSTMAVRAAPFALLCASGAAGLRCGTRRAVVARPTTSRARAGFVASVSATRLAATADLSFDAERVLDARRIDVTRSDLVSPGESTISRLWDLSIWRRHQRISRYARHLYKWPQSKTAQQIAPVCLVVAVWACLVHELRSRYFPGLSAPIAPLTLVSSAVALLLTLRTNQSLGRLQEARLAWGRFVLHSREAAGLMMCYASEASGDLFCRHVCLLGWSLKAKLREEDDKDAVALVLPPDDAARVLEARKRPVALLRGARRIVASEAAAGRLDAQAHLALIDQLFRLNTQIGVCERLMASPVPPTITRHTSRVLLTWLASVPLGLVCMDLGMPVVVVATLATSYVMVGIDQIGVELEQPFQLLPMNSLSAALMRDVVDERYHGARCIL